MEKVRRNEAMKLIRAAADILEQECSEMIMPGWEPETEGQEVLGGESHRERCAGIRAAAKAVLADGLDGDHGTKVEFQKLGFLIRYIGDMLEA